MTKNIAFIPLSKKTNNIHTKIGFLVTKNNCCCCQNYEQTNKDLKYIYIKYIHFCNEQWHGSLDILSNTLRADFHYFFILAFNMVKIYLIKSLNTVEPNGQQGVFTNTV